MLSISLLKFSLCFTVITFSMFVSLKVKPVFSELLGEMRYNLNQNDETKTMK